MSESERQRLLSRLASCKGREIYRTHEALRRTYRTLKVNYNEFESAVETLAKLDEQGDTAGDEYHTALSEVCTRFHNFVCATKSTYEHTTTVRGRYFNSELEDEYDRKWNEIEPDSKRGHFIRQIRNYTVHELMPPLETKHSASLLDRIKGREVRPTVYFDTETLIESWDFNEGSEAFLREEHPETIDVMQVVDSYYSNIAQVNSWMTQTLRDEYSEELEERDEIIRDLRELISE